MTIGQILPEIDLWNVEASPADIAEMAEWDLSGDGGRQRVLVVEQFTDIEAAVEQIDVLDPDAPRVILNLVCVNDAYELRSLSFEDHFNTLWIFFGPSLPLPGASDG